MASQTLTPLRAEDARILALESGPIRGHTLKVLLLEDTGSELPVDGLRDHMAAGLRDDRRWTQRLVPAPGTPTGLAWQDDPRFDVADHVGIHRGTPVTAGSSAETAPSSGDLDATLLRAIAEIMTVPLDRDRPLWRVVVLPRLADGRSAVVWKIHHCLADGLTVMGAGPRLLWSEHQTTAHGTPPRPGPSPALDGSATGPTAGARAAARLERIAGYRGLMVREFRRTWRRSPLAGQVGPDRVAAVARCTLDELRAIGKAVGPAVTVNDVLLAVVTGALRRWLVTHGLPLTSTKVQVPVSMHAASAATDADGNRDSFLLLGLPMTESDPVARLEAVAASTSRRKVRHDARAIYALRAGLSHAPTVVQHRLQRIVQGPREYSLNVSDVPGPRSPITVLGRRVEALYSFAEVAPRHGLRVAATSLEGSLFIGLLADPALVPDLDGLAAGIRAEVDALGQRLHVR